MNRGALDPKSIAVQPALHQPAAPAHGDVSRAGLGGVGGEGMGLGCRRDRQARQEDRAMRRWVATVKVEDKDLAVNRTEGLACLGGAANNNEDCYLYSKFARGLGVVYLEHQARI